MPGPRPSASRSRIRTRSTAKGYGLQALAVLFPLFHPALFGLVTLFKEKPMMEMYRKYPYIPADSAPRSPPPPPPPTSNPPQSTRSFLDTIAEAYSCHLHRRVTLITPHQSMSNSTYHRSRRRTQMGGLQHRCMIHHSSRVARPIHAAAPTQDDYLHLVDTYREFYSTQAFHCETLLPPIPFPGYENPQKITSPLPYFGVKIMEEHSRLGVPSDPTEKCIPDEKTPETQPPHECQDVVNHAKPLDDELSRALEELERTLDMHKCTHDQAFAAYSKLPSPGVSSLSEQRIRALFRRLSIVEKKDKTTALQYLSVVDDMKSTGLEMTDAEWNSAIAFCGQCFSHIRDEHMQEALKSWKEMEQGANKKAGVVTFNILFDMAAKTGKFVLGEMILREMEARGLEPNRYSRVSKIYFYGLRKDGDSIRRAYRELVEAGEVVDTVVLNCVIAALIAADELPSAEHVYGRMKLMLAERTGEHFFVGTWRESRDLGRLFDYLARENRSQNRTVMRKVLEDRLTITPNLHTFAIFIEHHASETGNLAQIAALLGEMQAFGVPLHGRIFLKLFKGFSKHGGEAYSDWTSWRLKKVYESLLAVLDQGFEGVQIHRWMVVWAVRAFDHCAGREWALHVWKQLKARWQPDEKDLEQASRRLAGILQPRAQADLKESSVKTVSAKISSSSAVV